MSEILRLLRNNSVVISYQILSYQEATNPLPFFYIKAIGILVDGSELHIRAYRSSEDRNYSFHWQKDGVLIIRWDNAPHHNELESYPHHMVLTRNKKIM